MSEKIKNYLLIFFVIVILILSFFLWSLLRKDVSGVGNPADNLRNALDDANREQQSATNAVRRIEDGIERSEGILNGIEERNRDAQEAIGRIEQAHSKLESTISGYEERLRDSEDILRENQRRLEDCLRTVQSIRESKESGN